MTAPKILLIDIETSPNTAHVWGLFKQTVSIKQLMDSSRVMCFAAKWYDKKKVEFHSECNGGRLAMIDRAYELLDEADWVVHYNGRRFDIPTLNKEFVLDDLAPPSPYKQIDLLSAVKSQFRFPSNKLDYVADKLGLGQKHPHEGHELWVKCMAGDARAWTRMRKYNIQDVRLLQRLYDRVLPWIPGHPNAGLFVDDGDAHCQRCGSTALHSRGYAYTATGKYRRFVCTACGSWGRVGKREPQASPLLRNVV